MRDICVSLGAQTYSTYVLAEIDALLSSNNNVDVCTLLAIPNEDEQMKKELTTMVMNHLQYEFGLVPVKIIKEDKAEYIQALIDAREQESLEPFREFMLEEHTRNITKEIEVFKKSQADDPIKTSLDPIKQFSDPIKQRLFQAVVQDSTLNYSEYAAQIGVSETTVKRRLGELKKEGIIIRLGSNKTGHWEIVRHSPSI